MSYCRFSDLNYYSEAYVYESVEGDWVTHIAGYRQQPGAPAQDLGILLAGDGTPDHPAMKLYTAQREIYTDWLEANAHVPIDHPEAGSFFRHATPGECADNLERLTKEGFIISRFAVDALRQEQAEMDADPGKEVETSET